MTSNQLYRALSPVDRQAHLIDRYALRASGQYAARCGKTMPANTIRCRLAPGHRCPGCLR
jgi:hypothetical protein